MLGYWRILKYEKVLYLGPICLTSETVKLSIHMSILGTTRVGRYKSVEIQHSLSIDQTIANLDHFD